MILRGKEGVFGAVSEGGVMLTRDSMGVGKRSYEWS